MINIWSLSRGDPLHSWLDFTAARVSPPIACQPLIPRCSCWRTRTLSTSPYTLTHLLTHIHPLHTHTHVQRPNSRAYKGTDVAPSRHTNASAQTKSCICDGVHVCVLMKTAGPRPVRHKEQFMINKKLCGNNAYAESQTALINAQKQ